MLKRLTNIVLYNLHILTILMMCSLYLMLTRSFVFQIGQNIILHYSFFYLGICIPSGFLSSRPAWLRRGVPAGQQRVGRAAARAAKPRIISPVFGIPDFMRPGTLVLERLTPDRQNIFFRKLV